VVSALGTPTEDAAHGTVKNRGSHLEALVTLYSIKPLFVAASVMYDTVVEPSAPFDSRVITYQMVFLPLQHGHYLVRNRRLQRFQPANLLEG
jgi:hypothetical protein